MQMLQYIPLSKLKLERGVTSSTPKLCEAREVEGLCCSGERLVARGKNRCEEVIGRAAKKKNKPLISSI